MKIDPWQKLVKAAIPLALVATVGVAYAAPQKFMSGETLTANKLNANIDEVALQLQTNADGIAALQTTTTANTDAITALQDGTASLACGDNSRMLAGAAACKALSPSANTFVLCGTNGGHPNDLCQAALPGATVAHWWQFNYYVCNDPIHPCLPFALGNDAGTSNAVIGTNAAVVCCTF